MYNRRSKCIISKTSSVAREPVDLSFELNYGISKLLDQSILNAIGLPVHHCAPSVMPDFIALNTEPGLFHHTKLTAVAFYTFDRSFDNIDDCTMRSITTKSNCFRSIKSGMRIYDL